MLECQQSHCVTHIRHYNTCPWLHSYLDRYLGNNGLITQVDTETILCLEKRWFTNTTHFCTQSMVCCNSLCVTHTQSLTFPPEKNKNKKTFRWTRLNFSCTHKCNSWVPHEIVLIHQLLSNSKTCHTSKLQHTYNVREMRNNNWQQ